MKRDVIAVLLLALVSVGLIVFGIYIIGTMPAVSHRGTSNIPAMVLMVGLMFSASVFTSMWLASIIKEANREIISWDDEDAYEYFSRELAEVDAQNE